MPAADARHLVIGTSLPVFVPGGIDDLQRWNERVCDGAWGRLGSAARREGPPRHSTSRTGRRSLVRSTAFVELLADLGDAQPAAPVTISVLSGDIHFSYHAELHFPASARR